MLVVGIEVDYHLTKKILQKERKNNGDHGKHYFNFYPANVENRLSS
jgi:hypothetical protein